MDTKNTIQDAEDRLFTNIDLNTWFFHQEIEPKEIYLDKSTDLVTFRYANTPRLNICLTQFYGGNVTVNARKFSDAMKRVRRLIKEYRTGKGVF